MPCYEVETTEAAYRNRTYRVHSSDRDSSDHRDWAERNYHRYGELISEDDGDNYGDEEVQDVYLVEDCDCNDCRDSRGECRHDCTCTNCLEAREIARIAEEARMERWREERVARQARIAAERAEYARLSDPALNPPGWEDLV